MNPIFSSTPREVQTVRCCGQIYKRWRFISGVNFTRFNNERERSHRGRRATHARFCKHCGQAIYWPPNVERQDIAAVRAVERRDAYYERRADFHMAGKTSKGKPRRRPFMPMSRQEFKRRQMIRYNNRKAIFDARGLTTRGTRRIYPKRCVKLLPLEAEYKKMRDGIPRVFSNDETRWELREITA